MAENNWVLQDGRVILVEFTTPQAATNWGWFGNRSSGEGLEFATPSTAWAEHAWLRGGQYIMAAEVGGAATITGTLAVTEGIDSFTSSGLVNHTGSLSVTEGIDTLAGTGKILHVGTLAVVEVADSFSSSGKIAHTGTLVATEGIDSFTGTGKIAHTGIFAITESSDPIIVIGLINHTGSLVVIEASDGVQESGFISHTGSLAITESSDTFLSSGDLLMLKYFYRASDPEGWFKRLDEHRIFKIEDGSLYWAASPKYGTGHKLP